jgi:hypothetical protein
MAKTTLKIAEVKKILTENAERYSNLARTSTKPAMKSEYRWKWLAVEHIATDLGITKSNEILLR